MIHECHTRYKTTQQRQYRGRPPVTEDGGVAGAKYACTLSLGRRACNKPRPINAQLHATVLQLSQCESACVVFL